MRSQTEPVRSRRLVLASASPRRRHLVGAFGLPFDVAAADLDETPRPGETAEPLACRLARAKALAVAERHPGAAVLAADSVVTLDGRLLGKPADADEARGMLRALRGRAHQVITGLALAIRDAAPDDMARQATRAPEDGGLAWHASVETHVEMRAYSDEEIERYVATGRPLDKAGAYAIQDPGFAPVARIVGCYPNVVGLPLCETRRALAAAGLLPNPSSPELKEMEPDHPACRLCVVARELEPPA